MKQNGFSFLKNYRKEFGGELLRGKRKSKRPLSTKLPIHLIIRSDLKGIFSPGNKSLLELIQNTARKFDIKIYDLALNWSHIHFVLKLKNHEGYTKFIRALTSLISDKIRRARPAVDRIFSLRPFTRILSWGRDFKNVLSYVVLNQLEARGLTRRDKKPIPSKKR